MSIRIIVADDNRLLRELLVNNLVDSKDIEVVAEVNDGKEAVAKSKDLRPDIVLMDIDMPVLDGVEATVKILRDFPEVRVIALSGHSNKIYIKKMLEAGAAGYLNKNCEYDELIKAIHTVHSGNKYLSEEITDIVIKDYLGREDELSESESELTAQRNRNPQTYCRWLSGKFYSRTAVCKCKNNQYPQTKHS